MQFSCDLGNGVIAGWRNENALDIYFLSQGKSNWVIGHMSFQNATFYCDCELVMTIDSTDIAVQDEFRNGDINSESNSEILLSMKSGVYLIDLNVSTVKKLVFEGLSSTDIIGGINFAYD